jgi:hypothetical protein
MWSDGLAHRGGRSIDCPSMQFDAGEPVRSDPTILPLLPAVSTEKNGNFSRYFRRLCRLSVTGAKVMAAVRL